MYSLSDFWNPIVHFTKAKGEEETFFDNFFFCQIKVLTLLVMSVKWIFIATLLGKYGILKIRNLSLFFKGTRFYTVIWEFLRLDYSALHNTTTES